MARAGYRIFDADTHVIEPVEPIEAYLSSADRAKLAVLGPLIGRAPAKGGKTRYQIGKRPRLDRLLGSRERVAPPASAARGGTPWDVRWQGPPFPSDRVSFDPHARVADMDIEGVDVNMILPSGGVPSFCAIEDVALEQAMYQAYHRYLADYCAPYPDRLTSLLLVSPARRRGVGRRDPSLGRRALAGGHLPDLPTRAVARRSRLGADLGGGAASRPDGRHPLVHDDGAVSAGRVGQLGQRVPAAGRRPHVERAAQHGGDHRGRACSIAIPRCA